MHRVLHISADVPDRVDRNKTPAVDTLIGRAAGIQSLVYSINRSPWPPWDAIQDGALISARYFGFPHGLGLAFALSVLAGRIVSDPRVRDFAPTLIHAHKLSFEGVAAARVAAVLGVPFVVTVRGNTDIKVLRYKPFFRRSVRRVLEQARWVFHLTPWALREVERLTGTSARGKSELLPNFLLSAPAADSMPAISAPGERFVTVFHLRNAGIKNLRRLALALEALGADGNAVGLDIVGGGTAAEEAHARRLVRGTTTDIRFMGRMDNAALRARLPEWKALVLPSYPETFGLVYLEALFAGIPILHAKESGVDGLFDGLGVSVSVDHRSVADITRGLRRLAQDELPMKQRVAELQRSGSLERFMADHVVGQYVARLESL